MSDTLPIGNRAMAGGRMPERRRVAEGCVADEIGRQATWSGRLAGVESLVNRRVASPRVRQWALGIAILVFVTVSVLSFAALPDGVHFNWWVLPVVVFVFSSLMALANAAEYRTMAAVIGHDITWLSAIRLTVIAGAANMLPLPGGVVIKAQALRARGSSYRHAFGTNAAAGVTWLGIGLLALAGLLVEQEPVGWLPVMLAVLGVAGIGSAYLILYRLRPHGATSYLLQLIVIESATVVIGTIRILFSFHLIGLAADPVQALALAAAAIVATAVGFFPAGLGLREVMAGAIGAAVSLPLANAIAATAADRIATTIGFALLAAVALLRGRTPLRASIDEGPDTPPDRATEEGRAT